MLFFVANIFYDLMQKFVNNKNISALFCIKCFMEKLLVIKKEKSSKLKSQKNRNSKKYIKKPSKIAKNHPFLLIFKQNWQYFLFLGLLFSTFILSIFLVFFKSEYYDFLKKPKIIQSPLVLILMLLLLAIILVIFALIFVKNESDKKGNLAKNENEKNCPNKQIETKIYCKKTFLNFYIFLVFGIFLTLSFLVKILWLSVIFSFSQTAICFSFLKNFNKNYWVVKVLIVLLLLLSVCILSSVYVLCMLN